MGRGAPPSLVEGGGANRSGGGVQLLLPLVGRPKEGFPPWWQPSPLPSNLYIVEVLVPQLNTQVLEPPLVDLVLVLVCPS